MLLFVIQLLATKQWGYGAANAKITYPLKVNIIYGLQLTTKATTFRYSPWPSDITTTAFTVNSDVEPAYWFGLFK